MKRFSIITVCFNSEKTIKYTFDSLLKQSYKDFEYIIIDGGSNDGTLSIIQEYSNKFKFRNIEFKWISEPDNGIYDAMNKGLKMSQGDIIGIINSDDKYMPWTLEVVNETSLKNPDIDVYHGLLRHVNNGELTRITGTSSNNLYKHMIEHPTCFVKSNVYKNNGGFDLQYLYASDYDFMIRLKINNYKFYLIEQVLAQFSENGAGNSWISIKEAINIKRKYNLISFYKYLYLLVKEKLYRLKR